jgi:hypothetical protein
VTRSCRDCGNSFWGEEWKTRCKGCFIEMKRREERGDDLRDAYREGYTDGLAAGSRGHELDPRFLRDLITLTHPDRHPGRFEFANRVTAQLVAMRNQLRRAA